MSDTASTDSQTTTLAAALATPPVLPDGRSASLAGAVLLDLDGRGITTISFGKSTVRYDLDADGLADQTGWIGTTEAFLFLDRDGNGTVTNAGELQFLSDLAGASSALGGLKAFDSNADGLISATDQRFAAFGLWTDANGNGVAETTEIQTLTAAGIRSISLAAPLFAGTNAAGDFQTIATGNYTLTNGTSRALADGALVYASVPRNGAAPLAGLFQQLDRRSGKYRIVSTNGVITVTGKGLDPRDARAGGLGGLSVIQFRNISFGLLSALVLDLDGNGVSLQKRGKAAGSFDINADGAGDRTGWIGARDGFLVIDRNANGTIDDGSEIAYLAESATAQTSLSGLARLDANADRVLDEKDARFTELRVWVDGNGNGQTEAGELKTLGELGIVSIGLTEQFVNQTSKTGRNFVLGTATFTRTNGTIGTLGDAMLAFEPGFVPLKDDQAALSAPGTTLVSAAEQMASALATFGAGAGTGDLDGTAAGAISASDLLAAANVSQG